MLIANAGRGRGGGHATTRSNTATQRTIGNNRNHFGHGGPASPNDDNSFMPLSDNDDNDDDWGKTEVFENELVTQMIDTSKNDGSNDLTEFAVGMQDCVKSIRWYYRSNQRSGLSTDLSDELSYGVMGL